MMRLSSSELNRSHEVCDELNCGRLGPVLSLRFVGNEPAMAAVGLEADGDVRIAGHHGLAKLIAGHERVVLSRKNQGRYADPIDDAHGARLEVVVARAGETVVWRGVGLVERADRVDAG